MMRLTSMVRFAALPAILLVALAVPSRASAQGGCITGSVGCTNAPELDLSMIGQGGALLSGAVLLLRARKKR